MLRYKASNEQMAEIWGKVAKKAKPVAQESVRQSVRHDAVRQTECKTTSVTIRLPTELVERLDAYAAGHGSNRTRAIIAALEAWRSL